MPRPGQGSSGGRTSSSHTSRSRTSSGHRMSSSSRSGGQRPGMSGSRFSTGSSRRPGGMNQPGFGPSGFGQPGMGQPSGPMRQPRRSSGLGFAPLLFGMSRRRSYDAPPPGDVGGGYGYGPRRRGSSGLFLILLVVLLVFGFFACFGCSSRSSTSASSAASSSSEITASTYNREKLEGTVYEEDCIVDELGWFDNIPQTEERLKSFFDQTGVQPVIVLKSYDPSLQTDEQKSAYAQQYYEENIDNENTFLYMYFEDADDSQIGYMETVNGRRADSVMDAQARDIFWNIIDREWISDKNMDDMIVDVYNTTAQRIMTKTTTSKDIWSKVLIIGIIIAIGGVIVWIMMRKRANEREKAAETERILSTPLQPKSETQQNSDSSSNDDEEDLLKKYGG